MKKKTSEPLVARRQAELDALAELSDGEIDTSDMSEKRDWTGARRGLFYKPVKRQITLRLDADLIEWFRRRSGSDKEYQTRINEALREYVARHSSAE